MQDVEFNRTFLDEIYKKHHNERSINLDPVSFLHKFPELKDREIVGLIASSLAYGRVEQINKSVKKVLEKLSHPYEMIANEKSSFIKNLFSGFKHRFTTEEHLIELFNGIKSVIDEHGSLHQCFISNYSVDDETIIKALKNFICEINTIPNFKNSLIPSPVKNSAMKRLNLFLRWMVRKDEIDPGGWDNVPTSKLIIPLDTHIHQVGLYFGLTNRKQGNLKTALEITSALKSIDPNDPVKYDFSLMQFNIEKKRI